MVHSNTQSQHPKNWPPGVLYIRASAYAPSLTASHIKSLRTKPLRPASSSSSPPPPATTLRELPQTLTPGPSPNVRIHKITDPSHPACNQAGLFAARDLAPGSLILPYLGLLHGSDDPLYATSDYDLWVTDRCGDDGQGRDEAGQGKERKHTGGVAVDATESGNEARFINDYRGVPGAVRPNAEFCEVWDVKRAEMGMAVFVMPAGANKKEKDRIKGNVKGKGTFGSRGGGGSSKGIAKGQEILVSYGKGFWEKRREEATGAGLA